MARLEPPISDAAAPFWEATRDRRLLLQWCKVCAQAIHYPREFCPACLGEDFEWRESPGQGEIYAFNVMHKPGNRGMADRANGLEIAMQDGRVNRRSVASVIKRRRPRRSSGF